MAEYSRVALPQRRLFCKDVQSKGYENRTERYA
jgi:hypothetical protein